MESKLQLQKNANVLSADGRQVGSIDRVVLNPHTKVVTHIVVRKSHLFNKEEKVVPIDMVARTTEEEIDLRNEVGDLESSPPFEEKRFVRETGEVDLPTIPPGAPPVIYGSSVLGTPLHPVETEKFVTEIEQNIPKGTVALKEGAAIITLEGKHAGHVERVLADVPADRATHLLVSSGMLTKEKKLIPIKWVDMIDENEVYLSVEKEELDKLSDISVTADEK
ncbi:MAG TPA: hypothetical protein VHM28_04615 [Anaerolineales bacterium]|nr:hypothetical protein [Anaerolineales bacterium]